jgi:serine/threonine protein kinase
MIGTQLGHYRIVRLLGRGGGGDVYAAEDTTLNRSVALKVLSEIAPGDRDRLERFQREAKTIAALNHPNVVTIYSVEEARGVPFLTMELVEGHALDQLITPNGLPLPELLRIAMPLVDAVAEAHQQGIVHRDLKPSNVMIGKAGRVKVLDFGLAKLRQDAASAVSGLSETIAVLTARHTIVGTAAYMSPEQAEGHPVDHRSDIFSLGILLYEMAAGRRPFKGDSVLSVLSSIIRDTPPPVAEINPKIPLELDRVIRRCLNKNPARRYQSAIDLRNDLEELSPATTRRSPVLGRRTAAAVAAVAVIAAVVGGTLMWRQRPIAGPRALTFSTVTSMPGREWFPSLSPDGKWLVYGAEVEGNFDVFLQSTSGSNPVNLTKDSTADDDMPAFSPDGERIAFRSSREGGGIFVMGRTGEAVKRVTKTGFNPAWSPDGTALAYSSIPMDINPQNSEGVGSVWTVAASGGEPRQIYGAGDAVQPSWSPHGKRIAFARRGGPSRFTDIWTVPANGGEATVVLNDRPLDWNPVWSPDGSRLYFVSDRSGTMNLWQIAIDEDTGAARGAPEPIVTPSPFVAHPTVSADGRLLAYSSVLRATNIQRLRLDPATAMPAGDPAWVTTGSRIWADPDPSPDGQFVAYYSNAPPVGHLYISRADGTGQRQLTGDAAADRMPHWSPDGKWLSTFSNRSGRLQLWKIRPDGSELQQITDDPGEIAYSAWAPDSARIVAASAGRVKNLRTIVLDSRRAWTAQTPDLLPPFPEFGRITPTSWSPDGARIVGTVGSTAPSQGMVMYTFATRRYDRLNDSGQWPVWLPDSRRILFGDGGRHIWVLDTQTKQSRIVYSGGRDVLGPPRVSVDGKQLYYSRRVTEADIQLITLR